jgi:hypothetical protein
MLELWTGDIQGCDVVPIGTGLDDVAEEGCVDIVACATEDGAKKATGRADERFTRFFFVFARSFADDREFVFDFILGEFVWNYHVILSISCLRQLGHISSL